MNDRSNDALAWFSELTGGPAPANKSLLMLLALGRLVSEGVGEVPWSVAEVALADLIDRFGDGTGSPGDLSAARAFTGLVADQVWTLDTEVPADSVRPRMLNEWHVTGRLDPELERALLSTPGFVREAARSLALRGLPHAPVEEVLAAVGLPEAGSAASLVGAEQAVERRRVPRSTFTLNDYLNLTARQAREQFRALLGRRPVPKGKRQEVFIPVETLLCLAASFRVNHRSYGGNNAHTAGEPVPELARLFARPPGSVISKMANLDGSRSHGAANDARAGARLREQPTLFTHIYRVLLYSARAEGIGSDQLPDFLGLEDGGELELLGQEELRALDAEDLVGDPASGPAADGDEPSIDPETERIMMAAARVGQHLFAQNVLRNCGDTCVFCGLRPASFGGRRMLLAGHIKPWRDSSHRERLDLANGLAACPIHDAAFDGGLITVEDDLRIRLATSLSAAIEIDELAGQYYGKPPMFEALRLPSAAELPRVRYMDWHRTHVFVDQRRALA